MTAEQHVRELLAEVDNPEREGLRETPARYVRFLREFIGKDKEFKFTTFDSEGADEMIVVSEIPFYSLCEHHLAPFFGTATVGYIPNGRIVGLSKLARTVDYYARNLQNQERITTQVVERVVAELDPVGAGCVIRAQHLCMSMRGIRKPGAITTTSKMHGQFRDDPACRDEFMRLALATR